MISDVKTIKVQKAQESKLHGLNESDLKFGKTFTDHMLVCDSYNGVWGDPQIMPYQDIPMDPATSFIHYGQSIFEGLKAHRSDNGKVYLFHPWPILID